MNNLQWIIHHSQNLGVLMGVIAGWSHDAKLLLSESELDDNTRALLENMAQFETILDIDTSELVTFVMERRRNHDND